MTADAHSVIGIIFGACQCKDTFDCTSSIDAHGGIVLWLLIMLYMFKALGTVCDEYFVPSLEMISEKLELSNDVAGATFMAAGSSAPELFTSLVATFLIVNEGGVGTIIGSAIFNILVIVGATCLFAGQELTIDWYPLARDCSFYVLAIAELSIALAGDSEVQWYEGLIMTLSYFVYIFYMKHNHRIMKLLPGRSIVEDVEDPEVAKPDAESEAAKPEADKGMDSSEGPRAAAQCDDQHPLPDTKVGNPNDGADPPNGDEPSKKEEEEQEKQVSSTPDVVVTPPVSGEPIQKIQSSVPESKNTLGLPGVAEGGSRSPRDGSHHAVWSNSELQNSPRPEAAKPAAATTSTEGANGNEAEQAEETEDSGGFRCPDPLLKFWELVMPSPERYWLLFSLSILNIAFCTYLMVDAVNRTGCNLNVQPLIMGLIFLAAGTSVPDALGSIAVAKQGEGDMAVANAFGSNVFDIMLGLGFPWFLSTTVMQKKVVFPGAGEQLLEWIIILTAILVLFVLALVINKWKLNKVMGATLMGFYVVYVIVALVRAFL